jgi:DNA-binding NarL/FixJ family response regulator
MVNFDLSFKVFHELMSRKVTEILLVSSPYDAFIMEEEGRLAERIIHEYRGLNLSRPPMLTWVSTAHEALDMLSRKPFDLVLTMPRLDDMDAFGLGSKIKAAFPNLPVFLLAHQTSLQLFEQAAQQHRAIDHIFVWSGNADLLLALIKNVEDRMNIDYDTERARVRVIIMVEDSPIFSSSLLPLLYKEIVSQTQAVMEDTVNEEHRLFRMRARPKIVWAENYEEAENLYRRFKPFLLGVLSDVRFPRNGKLDGDAGLDLLRMIRHETPDVELLNFSSEEHNRERAAAIPAVFLNKNSPTLHRDIRTFFEQNLGFGDFIFQGADGREVARASSLREMERVLPLVPEESVYYHAVHNHFSRWLMARSEILLASKIKPVKASDFESAKEIARWLVACIRERRKGRQKGVITDFAAAGFDPDVDFIKIGKGSLGGKARGLAFMTSQIRKQDHWQEEFPTLDIQIPQTVVISTEGFDTFIAENHLRYLANAELDDGTITEIFLAAPLPQWLIDDLKPFLEQTRYPLAIRSSSLLEDAQFQPFAGIYRTYMLPNNHPDDQERLIRLMKAIKLVYASTYLQTPRSYAQNTMHRTEDEKMAVIIQKLVGRTWGEHFYPALSGVAQSYNFYPLGPMKPEEGIVHIALGLGKTVVEGGTALRFAPNYPQFMPQFSTVQDILKNAQRYFYGLKLTDFPDHFGTRRQETEDVTLAKLNVAEAARHLPAHLLFSHYNPQDNRIRESSSANGHPLLTFAGILKHNLLPLPAVLRAVLDLGRRGMGCPVEIEFSVQLSNDNHSKPTFNLLQIRPMVVAQSNADVCILEGDCQNAFGISHMALGNGVFNDIEDIICVRRQSFDVSQTPQIAAEIGKLNAQLAADKRRYLLIGPGRWGSADRWLGIPVGWNDIHGVAVIVETATDELNADPSQGSHFFHNITSLGLGYLTIPRDSQKDFIAWKWLESKAVETATTYLDHIHLTRPITVKIDGRQSKGVLLTADAVPAAK